jgi:5-methylcytosine-specific restriction protein A
MERPFVWQMIREAIDNINGQASYDDIKNYINDKWENVNQKTINAQIIAITVNHDSRGYYPENRKPRLTNSHSPYDVLFKIGRGLVMKYDAIEHGIWEVYEQDDHKLSVRRHSVPMKIFTPADIIWFKNVTNQVNGEAYLDLTDDEFTLHFPTIHETNAGKPQVGEIILIRQKVNGIPAFTHLVTPADMHVDDANDRSDYQYGRRVKIIAKTNIENFIPVSETLWDRLKYGGITQGNACRIKNINNVGNVDELQFDIWQKFHGRFVAAGIQSESVTSSILTELENTNPELSVTEGELLLVSHLVKERNRKIVNEKKNQAIKNNTLICEVCEFSFPSIYGAEFIECHHIIPISQPGIRETTLKDLSLVCANCHRMLHKKFDGEYLSIKQLSERMKSLK